MYYSILTFLYNYIAGKNKTCVIAEYYNWFIISSGQGGLLLKYWRWIGTIKDNIPEQYKIELGAVEDQGI